MDLNCPKCGKEVQTLRVQYECADGHTWGEEVDRTVTAQQTAPSQASGVRMPFGKHKGELLENIPSDYIHWCLEKLDDLRPDLREEMQNQLDLRSGKGVRRQEVKREGTKFIFGK